jgi:hypothetical protein
MPVGKIEQAISGVLVERLVVEILLVHAVKRLEHVRLEELVVDGAHTTWIVGLPSEANTTTLVRECKSGARVCD